MIELMPWILVAAVVWFALRKNAPAEAVKLTPLVTQAPVDPSARPAPPPNLRWRGGQDPYATPGTSPHPLTVISILAAGAMISWAIAARPAPSPSPDNPPAPAPAGWPTIDLRGAFVGEHAAEDALTTHYLLKWLSDQIRYDGTLTDPRLKTASAFDELRRVARDGRMEGGTLGQRQPLAKERIKAFLDAAVGDSGGPVDAAGRDKFIRAFHDVSSAAAVAAGRTPE